LRFANSQSIDFNEQNLFGEEFEILSENDYEVDSDVDDSISESNVDHEETSLQEVQDSAMAKRFNCYIKKDVFERIYSKPQP
jgi:hypothetical protein